jgi:dihydroorotate dehydrogenase electron transfer subunit
MKKQQLNCKILANDEVCKNNFIMQIEWPNADKTFMPGQFIEVETTINLDPLIRRPFSIFDTDENSLKIAYKKLGKGTTTLSSRKIGEMINIIGPLGNFYPTHKIKNAQKIVIVGGGTGIASVHYLAKFLDKTNQNYTLLIGFRSQAEIFCDLNLKGEIILTTNDGSVGKKGFVTEHFDFKNLEKNTIIFICGPMPMTRAIQALNPENIIYASLEEYMGCGLGLCNGCVVKLKKENGFEFKRVCKNGPIFNLKDILWT